MKSGLSPGTKFTHTYVVPTTKTVRHIYTEAEEFVDFPEVFATGYMIALIEWACTKALQPYLDPGEGSLGVAVCVSHDAATPPGFTVTVHTKLVAVHGRRLVWEVVAHDGIDEIGRGTQERTVIDRKRFDKKLAQKMSGA